MARGLFITGTDTGCGKTEITLGFMHKLQQRGDRVLGMKPVASGADETVEGLRNEDALRIQSQCSQQVSYDWINPYAYAPPIAPHLAAEAAGRSIDTQRLVDICTRLGSMADSILVEGVGGWSVPLNEDHTLGDLAKLLDLPVILVVGLKLGCINHALMTESCINHSGSRLLGWVANQVDTAMDAREGNLRTLSERLSVPCLGVIPWLEQPTPAEVAGYLDDSLL